MIETVISEGTTIGNSEFQKISFISKHYNELVKCQFEKLEIKFEGTQYYVMLKSEYTTMIEPLEYHFEKLKKKHPITAMTFSF